MHKKTPKGRFAALYQKFYDPDSSFENEKMICSEFAAKTILAGLLEQERQLKEQMVDYLVEQKEMKRGEAKKFVDKAEVFSLPYF